MFTIVKIGDYTTKTNNLCTPCNSGGLLTRIRCFKSNDLVGPWWPSGLRCQFLDRGRGRLWVWILAMPNLIIVFLLEIGSIWLGRLQKGDWFSKNWNDNNNNNKDHYGKPSAAQLTNRKPPRFTTFFNLDMWRHLQYFQNINVVL